MVTDKQIINAFPFKDFRPDQMDAIRAILSSFDKGKKFAILEAPCGMGKSAVAYAITNFFNNAFWVCPQKFLQDQIQRDFGIPPKPNLHPVIDLKGRGNYKCTFSARSSGHLLKSILIDRGMDQKQAIEASTKFANGIEIDVKVPSKIMSLRDLDGQCDKGVCRTRDNESKCDECFPMGKRTPHVTLCNYWKRHNEALNAKVCLMNFKAFLFQTIITKAFGPRELLIVDEGHNIESELMNFIGLTLSDKSFKEHGITFPGLKTAAEYKAFIEEKRILDIINDIMSYARIAGDTKKEDEWMDIGRKCKFFISTAGNGNWVSQFKRSDNWNTIELKPIYVSDMANEYLFNKADHVLIMSATILSPKTMCSSLGIEPASSYSMRFGSRFPVSNRPVYFTPVGSLSFKNKTKTFPDIIRTVDVILNAYLGMKGIIHTHNFEIAKLLMSKCRGRKRMLFQEDWESKTEMLAHHTIQSDSVIVAPAMHEGLDLKDDLARFQIIIKVPYPSLRDNPQLEARIKDSNEYYDWLTCLKLVQSVGRAVRSDVDWAHTYILDSDFGWFRKKVEGMLPAWLTESIIEARPDRDTIQSFASIHPQD